MSVANVENNGPTGRNTNHHARGLTMAIINIDLKTYDTDQDTVVTIYEGKDLPRLLEFRELHTVVLTGIPGITDLSSLASIKSLRTIGVEHCEGLRDISVAAALPGLIQLRFSSCKRLKSLEGLIGCNKLQELKLFDCEGLSDVSQLAQLPAIYGLHIRGCRKLTDISVTANIKTLQHMVMNRSDCPFLGTPKISDAEWEIVKQIPLDRHMDMACWHASCGTTHCLAGWAQVLMGKEGVAERWGREYLPSLQRYFYMTGYTGDILAMLRRIHAERGSTPVLATTNEGDDAD